MIPWKTYLILALLCCSRSFAQDSIRKADGTKIIIASGSAHVDYRHKQLKYKLPENGNPQTIAFRDLSKATSSGSVFRIFREGKKINGYYVIADNNGLALATATRKKISAVGGFNVPYIVHEMVVFDNGKVIDRISFSENNDRKNTKKRLQAREIIADRFSECAAVLKRLALFANTDSNLKEGDVAEFLDPPLYLPCH